MKAVFLLGPTASGKTAVALALAERFPVEIVSVDSAQVYRGMDVGTAKPDAATRARVPHHLVDVIDPTESFSAGRFVTAVHRLVPEIHARGRLPILAGGTMLYFRALTGGLADLPVAQPALRRAIEEDAAQRGWAALHGDLATGGPVTAARLDPTDSQRIQRALEVHRVSGRAISSFHAETAAPALPFETLRIALEPSDRAVLHRRIAQRFAAMLREGLVEELRALRERYPLHAQLPSMRTVGYRQAWDTLEGAKPAETLEARGIAATRQLAKRQLTWLRSMAASAAGDRAQPALERYDCLREDLAPAIAARVEDFVSPRRGT